MVYTEFEKSMLHKIYSAREENVSFGTNTTMINCVISHITFIRATLPLLSVECPSIHKSARRMAKSELTGHEKITSLPRLLYLQVNIQWGHCFTQVLMSNPIRDQKN